VLERAYRRHPGDRDILIALVTFNRDAGAYGPALEYAQQLLTLNPQDRDAQQLYADLAVAAQKPPASH
jgi:hypothetical protein